jgi:DNA-binding NarL/FixJ family response regulator
MPLPARARSTVGTTELEPPDTCPTFGHVLKALIAREREAVSLNIEGLHDKQIAERPGTSYTAVRKYVDRSFQKIGVGKRATLIRSA